MKHTMLIVLCFILTIIAVIQCACIRSQGNQIRRLNRELIHIQTCREAMEAVKQIEKIGKDIERREKEFETGNFDLK